MSTRKPTPYDYEITKVAPHPYLAHQPVRYQLSIDGGVIPIRFETWGAAENYAKRVIAHECEDYTAHRESAQ